MSEEAYEINGIVDRDEWKRGAMVWLRESDAATERNRWLEDGKYWKG